MFKEKVDTRTSKGTDPDTDRRTHDNRPWHKLAGLRPVELKMWPLGPTQGKKLTTHDRHSTITIAH